MGRSAEIELFRSALDDASDPSFSVLHIQGPGGVGKTTLLEAFGVVAAGVGATVVHLDGSDLDPSPVSVLESLEGTLAIPSGGGAILPSEGIGRLVMLVDAYEQLMPLDHWFRARLLPRLPASALIVIAGRETATQAWRTDPTWGALLRVVSLRNLNPEDSRAFLRKAGLDERLHEPIVRISYGHPLGLALLADVAARGGQIEPDVLPLDLVEVLLPRFVGTVPDDRLRRALGACAVARCTTEPLLRTVLEEHDVHDVFAWLRALSFIELKADGVGPHDLARDVLDADLRWRDLDSYTYVFRKVREHGLASSRAATGRAQQRAIFDLKFLFRQVRTATAPVDWGSWGDYYPERASPEDRGQILELVRIWEGEQSAAIAARWLDQQPEGFFVIRDLDDEVRGMLAILDLARSSLDDIDADPGARAAWDFALGSTPPRPGESVTLCRFVVDRESHQGPSPTLNAVPILTMQIQLSTPNLSWDFVALADPDRWNDYFAAGDLPRAEGADFSVGAVTTSVCSHTTSERSRWTPGLSFGPSGRWHRMSTRPPGSTPWPCSCFRTRTSRQPYGKESRICSAPTSSHETRWCAPGSSPIAAERGESGAAVLEAVLREGAATLARHPRDDKLLRAVDRTYLRPAGTQEAAAAVLGLPFSTYRRHLTQGMTRIVSWVWDQEVYGQGRAEVSTT